MDLVADVRASTPTDAARKVVPDLKEEHANLAHALESIRSRAQMQIKRESEYLNLLKDRPVLKEPTGSLQIYKTGLTQAVTNMRHFVSARIDRERAGLVEAAATLRALSPQATLERGYSIVKAPGVGLVKDLSLIHI